MSNNHVALITHVKDLLIAQGVKSFVQDGGQRCYYRCENENGVVLKCAIGHLIPVSKYRSAMEDLPCDLFLDYYSNSLKSVLAKFKLDVDEPEVRLLLGKLQNVHDYHEVNEWSEAFDNLITEYK